MMLNLPGWVWMILLLLHTADCGRFEIITPNNQITAEAGDTIILPCFIKSRISAEDMIVEWVRHGHIVHRYEDGRDDNKNQDPSFKTRTTLFREELKTGIVSLKLLRVRGTDQGTYNCSVMSPTMNWQDDSNIKVDVKAVGSQPVVSIEGHRGAGMGLVCETQGWYPQPEVVWRDSEGVSLSADPPETTTDTLGLYTLRLRVTVQKTDRNLFNCRVKQKYMERDETAGIQVPDELFYQDHSWKMFLAVGLSVSVSVGLAAVAICVLMKRQRDKDEIIKEKASIIHDKGLIIYHQETLSRQLDLVNTRGCQDYEAVRRHAVDVTLDPDTAHPRLILSDGGKQVSCGYERQDLPETPKRYNTRLDVLGKQGFSSGRFYYEVQVNNNTEWHLGVAKESCKRKGEFFLRPKHGYWTITLRKGGTYLALTDIHVHLLLSQEPQKVGVFVDYEEGTVSFYNVEARSHIFSFTGCCFKEKLHPFFSPGFPGVSGDNSDPLVICSVDNLKPESLHLSEPQTDSSDSAHQSSVNQGPQPESSEQMNELVRLLEHSASYKV